MAMDIDMSKEALINRVIVQNYGPVVEELVGMFGQARLALTTLKTQIAFYEKKLEESEKRLAQMQGDLHVRDTRS